MGMIEAVMQPAVIVAEPAADMTTADIAELLSYEAVIKRGLQTFVEVGNALAAIRDAKLYRGTHGTFLEYCRDRWGLGRSHVYRLMDAAQVAENLAESSPIGEVGESVLRPLAKLEPDHQREAWADAVEAAPDGKPTAAHVEKAVAKFAEPKPREAKPDPEPKMPPDLARVGYSLWNMRNGDNGKWGWRWQLILPGSMGGLGIDRDHHFGPFVTTTEEAIEGARRDWAKRQRASGDTQARAVYMEPSEPASAIAPNPEDMPDEPIETMPLPNHSQYTHLIEAGFVLERLLRNGDRRTRWAWPTSGYRGKWAYAPSMALQQALDWYAKYERWSDALMAELEADELTPPDWAQAGVLIERVDEGEHHGYRYRLLDHPDERPGALHDDPALAIESVRRRLGIWPDDDPDEQAAIAQVADEQAEEDAERAARDTTRAPAERATFPLAPTPDERLEDARALIDLLVAARDTARRHYGELTGRHTDLLEFERGVDKMLAGLGSLVDVLEKGGVE